MAKKGLAPAELSYNFIIPNGNQTKFIDLAQCASFVNRRLYQQGRCYYISRISVTAFGSTPGSGGAGFGLTTLPDTWVTSNAWVKAKALWSNMNKKVLDDNPSTQGKWADFKVFFDAEHRNGGTGDAGPTLNLKPVSGITEVESGEWVMSEYVQPQHTVNTGTGEPLAADEYTAHMLGPDVTGGGSPDLIKSAGIIHGYADTRARVQAEPSVPADMSTSWMTLLTDDGSQEPELAQMIEDQNDLPPYHETNYPGGDTNFISGVTQSYMILSPTMLQDKDLGFKVPCGLLKVSSSITGDGSGNGFYLSIHLVPGTYKGLHATELRQ